MQSEFYILFSVLYMNVLYMSNKGGLIF